MFGTFLLFFHNMNPFEPKPANVVAETLYDIIRSQFFQLYKKTSRSKSEIHTFGLVEKFCFCDFIIQLHTARINFSHFFLNDELVCRSLIEVPVIVSIF